VASVWLAVAVAVAGDRAACRAPAPLTAGLPKGDPISSSMNDLDQIQVVAASPN